MYSGEPTEVLRLKELDVATPSEGEILLRFLKVSFNV
jgi:NADPH:quinone reductase-like Zn-dependent oxidoreductase